MKKNRPKFVRAVFDLECTWEGLPPVYRIYVNDEMFTERQWRWENCYLEEILQIEGPPGRYIVRIEKIGPSLASFHWSNHRVDWGDGQWLRTDTLEIKP